MSVIHAPQEKTLDARILIVPGVLVLVLASYFTRLWFLQVVIADDLQERAQSTGITTVSKLAPRGRIYDRSGKLIAGLSPTVVITAKPKIALKNPEGIALVAALLGIDVKDLTGEINDVLYAGELPIAVYVGAPIETASHIAELGDEAPGFSVETQPMRTYTDAYELAHVLGYVRTPRKQDVERLKKMNLEPAQYVGIQGLERRYEPQLMGKPGTVKQAVDARRRPIRDLGADAPIPGSTLTLGLDTQLQHYAFQLLAGRRGSVVVLDPRNGEVLCLASSPSYDASLFLKGISRDDYSSLVNDPTHPFLFRGAASAYPPGSTFKMVTTMAAWLTGKFSMTRTNYCDGYVHVGNRKAKCLGVHRSIAYDTAFAQSCNSYFGNLAMLVGREALLKVCEEVGLGKPTGLDVPGEAGGTVPTPEWWAKNRTRPWSLGDTVNFGIGQGELATTPLQMACLTALVANRGVSYKPHLLRCVTGPQEGAKPEFVQPEVLGQIEATPDQWQDLTQAMYHVLSIGTARKSSHQFTPNIAWAGKTGSAENQKGRETHSWFVGFAPLNDPQIVVSVVVENAGHGSEAGAPIAAQIVKYWLEGRKTRPTVDVQSSLNSASSESNSAPLDESRVER
ncbi:MAG: penicillin-binding protein 2 [Armatimonadetes bacterium]|nr:penicillin-binding protein 2 [Armatimonadota bacterium]